MTALALIAAGVFMTAAALTDWRWDFAVAVMPGWHMTIFPPPVFVAVFVVMSGIAALIASLLRR